MIKITISDICHGLTETNLTDFERKYSFSLPDDYRAFLLQFNAGEPERNRVSGFSQSYMVRVFLGLT